jgi:hypothetical protein
VKRNWLDALMKPSVAIIAVCMALATANLRAQSSEPPWRLHVMPWETHAGQPRPWRDDPRLNGKNEPGYPDDFLVSFANPDSAHGAVPEYMWVRVIAYDLKTDLFLGILLNQSFFQRSVREGDNVVFRIDPKRDVPLAIGGPDYAAAGWPSTNSGAFGAALREGVRAYRAGNNGHNMPAIEHCISVLTPAMATAPANSTRDEQFVGHYVLGRCLAEKYVTLRAIAEFRAAIALDLKDADSHMALLAELSVMTHTQAGVTDADAARWEREFLEELAIVRRDFATYDGVAQTLSMIFDPAQEKDVAPAWQPQIEKLRRVGYAIFRWKQR